MPSKKAMPGVDYTTLDYEGFRTLMLAKLGEKMPEYTDRSATDAGIVILELNAIALDIISYYVNNIANEIFFTTAQQRGSVLEWCKILGYTPRSATPAKFMQVFRLASVKATDYTIPKGTAVCTSSLESEDVVYFETEADLVIPAGKLGNETLDGEYLYKVSVIEGTSVFGEVLGSSTGSPDQTFQLGYYPVIEDSIVLTIDEGSGLVEWTRVDSFVESEAYDRHYKISVDDQNRMKIVFGNGVFGKIPLVYQSGITCSYRVGGGANGNVGVGKISEMETNLADIKSTFNPELAYVAGVDAETLEEIKVNAISSLRTIWGALTLNDFKAVIEANFPEVLYAQAYKNGTDDLDIYIMTRDASTNTTTLFSSIGDFFSENNGGRKIVGVDTITLHAYVEQPLTLNVKLYVAANYVQSEVIAAVQTYLTGYFARGERTFEEELSLTDLSSLVVEHVPGVRAVMFQNYVGGSASAEVLFTPDDGKIFTLAGYNTFDTTGGLIPG
jgi:hypothetical protein